jgi:hypothetical protein
LLHESRYWLHATYACGIASASTAKRDAPTRATMRRRFRVSTGLRSDRGHRIEVIPSNRQHFINGSEICRQRTL